MQVIIDEIVTSLRAVDGDSVLAPRTLDRIVRAVLQAIEDKQCHDERVRSELSLDGARVDRSAEHDR